MERRNQQRDHPAKFHRAVGKYLAFRDKPCEQESVPQETLGSKPPFLPHYKHSIGGGSSAGGSEKEVQDTFGDLLSYPLN